MKKSTKRNKAESIKKLKVTDGENTNIKEKKYRSLAEIMGDDMSDPKNIEDFDAYRSALASMNTADLERECIRVGMLPRETRGKMIELLERVWKKTHSKYRNVHIVSQPEIEESNRKKLKDILSESR